MSIFMKIPSVGAELFLADGERKRLSDGWTGRRTDMIKPIVVFRNFAKAPKKHYVVFRTAFQLGLLFKQRQF